MYEKVESCPICEQKEFSNHLICKDYLVSDESFVITKCNNCQFLFTNPRPDKESIKKYYNSDQYISHNTKKTDLISIIYKSVRKYTTKNKIDLISKYTDKKNVLDFGCGTGYFLQQAKNKGWNIKGYEPNINALTNTPINIRDSISNSLNDIQISKKLNIITLWHVLEHIHDLNETIILLKSILKKKGYIFIAVPNHLSFDAQHYKEFWAGYDLPRHLYHFDQTTMNKLVRKHDLMIKEIVPMKFDSYYVSMLSEKYKSSKSNFRNFLINGYTSNRKASINNNYSSLIYIIKNK